MAINFNTSHVKVNPKWDQPCIKIICVISIHPMLKLIVTFVNTGASGALFQYIPC